MDRNHVEKMMGPAADALMKKYPTEKLDRTIRSKFSAFGATVIMSGLLPAIAFYQKNEPDTIALITELYRLENNDFEDNIFDTSYNAIKDGRRNDVTETILDIAVSLKLACNLFELVKSDGED